MKKLLIILTIALLMSCAGPSMPNDSETITTKFFVTEVYKAKYSKVKGYVFYNGIKVPVDNGGTGYYYHEYSLQPGDVIIVNITIGKEYGYNYVLLRGSDVDVSKYIKE